MLSRTPACLSGVLGGACWVARYVLDDNGVVAANDQLGTALRWAGLTWIALAVFAAGAGLVSRSAIALRIVVGICVLLLAATALSLLYPVTGRLAGEALFGAAAILVSVPVYWLGRRRAHPAHHGSHVAD
jgi:hypothetical protein